MNFQVGFARGAFLTDAFSMARLATLALLGGTLGMRSLSAAEATKEALSPGKPPITITAGAEWIALRPELDIEAGSALDFSTMGLTEAPAGKHGRVIARPDGQFAFADSPDQPRRFYGVNLCFGAQYLSKAEA